MPVVCPVSLSLSPAEGFCLNIPLSPQICLLRIYTPREKNKCSSIIWTNIKYKYLSGKPGINFFVLTVYMQIF